MSTKQKIESRHLDNNYFTIFPLDTSFQGVKRLFAFTFNNTTVNVPDNPISSTNNRVLRDSPRKTFFSKSKYN